MLDPPSVLSSFVPPKASAKLRYTLAVQTLDASPSYATDEFAYRSARNPAELSYYNYHRWAAAPTELLQDVLVCGLRDAGLFDGVWKYGAMRADYVLMGTVRRFEEYDLDAAWQARLLLDLDVVDADTDEIVYSKVFEESVPVGRDERSPAGVARAMNDAVASVIETLVQELSGAIGPATDVTGDGIH